MNVDNGTGLRKADCLIPTRRSLLSRLKNWDDNRSWQDFFETYWKLIFNTARQAGLNDSESQDVVQETLISVSKSIGNFHYDPQRGTFKAWLRQVTSRRIIDQFRKRNREFWSATDATNEETVREIPDPLEEVIARAWEADWEKNLVDAAIARVRRNIAPKQFQVFELAVLREWPTSEVATTLKVSRGYIYLVKYRVNARIKKVLKRIHQEAS